MLRRLAILLFDIALALDYAVVLMGLRLPMSISALCGIAHSEGRSRSFLGRLGRLIDWFEPGHCESARQNDIRRCEAALARLRASNPFPPGVRE